MSVRMFDPLPSSTWDVGNCLDCQPIDLMKLPLSSSDSWRKEGWALFFLNCVDA